MSNGRRRRLWSLPRHSERLCRYYVFTLKTKYYGYWFDLGDEDPVESEADNFKDPGACRAIASAI